MSRRISSYQNTICKNGKLIHFDEITKRSIYTMNKSVYCFEKDNDVYYKLDRNEGFAYSIMNIYYKKSLKIKYPYFLKDKIDTCIANDSFHKMQNIFKPLPFMHLNEKLIDLFIKSMQCYTLDDRYILKSSFFKNGDLDTCSINGDYVIFKRDNNLFLSNYLYDDYLEQMKEVNKLSLIHI